MDPDFAAAHAAHQHSLLADESNPATLHLIYLQRELLATLTGAMSAHTLQPEATAGSGASNPNGSIPVGLHHPDWLSGQIQY